MAGRSVDWATKRMAPGIIGGLGDRRVTVGAQESLSGKGERETEVPQFQLRLRGRVNGESEGSEARHTMNGAGYCLIVWNNHAATASCIFPRPGANWGIRGIGEHTSQSSAESPQQYHIGSRVEQRRAESKRGLS